VSPSSVSLSPDSPSDEGSEVSLSRKPKRLDGAGGRAARVLRCSAALGLSAERSGVTRADNGTLFARIPAFDTRGGEEVEGCEGGLGILSNTSAPDPSKGKLANTNSAGIAVVCQHIRSERVYNFYS